MEIFCEYINVDTVTKIANRGYNVKYEPSEHIIDPNSLSVHLILGSEEPDIGMYIEGSHPFNIADHRYRINFENNRGVLQGWLRDNQIFESNWIERPGEHFLCVSYQTPVYKDTYKTNWLQEGF